jgi:hypothetical protein
MAMLLVFCSWMGVGACGGGSSEKAGSTCEKNCALNKCPNDAPAATCVSVCEMYQTRCPAEISASLQCRIGLKAGKLVCDLGSQVTTYADPVDCAAENNALAACLSM